MGYYCPKEDCKCPHYYNHVCYIEKVPVEEAKEFECECKPEIKDIDRYNNQYLYKLSYYGNDTRSNLGDGYYRNNYVL